MKTLTLVACVLLLSAMASSAQTPKPVQVTGKKALQLVSILVSGSDEIRNAVQRQDKSEIVIHDLSLITESTYKYDADSPYFDLAVHGAKGKVGLASQSTPIGEATALFDFFTALGLPTDTAMDGSFFDISVLTCSIDVKADIAAPNRFRCTITNSF